MLAGMPYRSFEAVRDEAAALGRLSVYGESVEGRPLLCVDVGGDGPALLVTAGLHGLEHIGVEVALEVARRGPIDGARLLVCPVLNPDGYARTVASGGDDAVGSLRKNARGVDLNRNFPLPWGARPRAVPFAGADDPRAATYRGPGPLSEPESASLAAWVLRCAPHASANLHSFMGTLIAARVWHPSDWLGYRRLAQAFRAGGGRYRRLGSPIFDVFTGELEDWQHHVVGTWAVCVECFAVDESLRQHLRAPTSFCRFNPADPAPIARRDAGAVRAMLAASLSLPRPPSRPGAASTLPGW